jgi:hypothetical protein
VARVVWYPNWRPLLYFIVDPKMHDAADIVERGAKLRCAKSSGATAAAIHQRDGVDAQGPSYDVVSDHKTADGYPVGLGLEVGTKAHRIYPKRAAALAFYWAKIGKTAIVPRDPGPTYHTPSHLVIGKGYVDHPGTKPQPYLRPALDDLRGRRL